MGTIFAGLLCAGGVSAADFSAPIVDLVGKPMEDCGDKPAGCGAVLTLSKVSTLALTMQPNTPANEKFKRFQLALKIAAGGEIGLKAEEIVLIKDAVAATMTPVVVGRVYQLLEPGKD